jgi:hypothetical protein
MFFQFPKGIVGLASSNATGEGFSQRKRFNPTERMACALKGLNL